MNRLVHIVTHHAKDNVISLLILNSTCCLASARLEEYTKCDEGLNISRAIKSCDRGSIKKKELLASVGSTLHSSPGRISLL